MATASLSSPSPSPIRLCLKCNQWRRYPEQFRSERARVCSLCISLNSRRHGARALARHDREMSIPGTEANEWAKDTLAKLMTPRPLFTNDNKSYDHAPGKRRRNKPPRFSHLPEPVRVEAESILARLMMKHQTRLSQPDWYRLYGSLVATASRIAQIHSRGMKCYQNQRRIKGLKRRLQYRLGLIEKETKSDPIWA